MTKTSHLRIWKVALTRMMTMMIITHKVYLCPLGQNTESAQVKISRMRAQ